MHTFQMIAFLISAVALPAAAIALAKSNLRAIGKAILFLGLAVAARYLFGSVWEPGEGWLRYGKYIVAAISAFVVWDRVLCRYLCSARPWVSFVAFMLLPVLVKFVFLGAFVADWLKVGSIAFWVVWTALGLLQAVAGEGKMTRFGRTVMVAASVALLSYFLFDGAEAKVLAYAGRLSDCLRQNVIERWEPIKSSAEKVVAAWGELVGKDRRAMEQGKVGARNVVATANIGKLVAKLREELLTVDSRAVLERVRELDRKVASARKSLASLREKRGLQSGQADGLDAKIAEAERELAALESSRADAVASARQELKSIGLDLPEKSPFLTLDVGTLIDNAIIARGIGVVVENLKALVDAEKGNAEAAKRYYGAYIVMLDVQAECFREYLGKAATGIWRDGVAEVAKSAEAAKAGNEAKAAAEGCPEAEKQAFLNVAGANEKILKAAQAYLAVLNRHEEIIKEKLAVVEKRHEVALSFWESADIASAFGAKAVSDMADFEALLELKLPELALFDDASMLAEFDAINKKLMKE